MRIRPTMRTMPRRNVYVSEDLQARMDDAGGPVNWSGVAAAAFEAKLAELEVGKEVSTMTQVIERLKASKADCENKERQHGHAAGKRWAKTRASWRELRDLVTKTDDDFWALYADRDFAWEIATFIDQGTSPSNRADFWEAWSGDKQPSQDWLVGFCEGAQEIYNAVKRAAY